MLIENLDFKSIPIDKTISAAMAAGESLPVPDCKLTSALNYSAFTKRNHC